MAKNTELSEYTSTKEGFVFVVEGKKVHSHSRRRKKISIYAAKEFLSTHEKKNAVHSLRADENTTFLLSLCQ